MIKNEVALIVFTDNIQLGLISKVKVLLKKISN